MIVVCGTETSAMYNTLIPERRSLALIRRMRMGWVHWRTREQGPGSTAKVQIFKSVRLHVESVRSSFGHTVRGGGFRSQRGDVVSVLQTRSSRMFVFKIRLVVSLTVTGGSTCLRMRGCWFSTRSYGTGVCMSAPSYMIETASSRTESGSI